MKKVAIYVRVSTTEQAIEGYSIPAQITTLKQYAVMNEYAIYKTYQDSGISGKNIKDRPALLELIEDAKNQKFDIVLVWKLSRLSRSLLDLLQIVEVFNAHNVSFQSFSEKFDTSTPMGKMLLHMLGSIAEFERNTIIENVKLGLNERFKQGYSKGAVPFGYINKDKKAELVIEQAKAVKYAFETYAEYKNKSCLEQIADYFNDNNFTTKSGGMWTRKNIKELLENKFYAGYVRTGVRYGTSKENYLEAIGNHEPIISLELFEAVQSKISSNKINPVIRATDNDCFLTGLILCPKCGGRLYSWQTYRTNYKDKDGNPKIYHLRAYRCNNASKNRNLCSSFSMPASKVENMIVELLKAINIKGIMEHEKNATKTITPEEDTRPKLIDKKLKELYLTKERYFKLFESGKVEIEMFADKLNGVLQQINDLEQEKTSLEKSKNDNKIDISVDFIKSLNTFMDFFDKLSNNEKKDLIRKLIAEVIVDKNKTLHSVKLVSGIEICYHK